MRTSLLAGNRQIMVYDYESACIIARTTSTSSSPLLLGRAAIVACPLCDILAAIVMGGRNDSVIPRTIILSEPLQHRQVFVENSKPASNHVPWKVVFSCPKQDVSTVITDTGRNDTRVHSVPIVEQPIQNINMTITKRSSTP
jgi:hypothetical protein